MLNTAEFKTNLPKVIKLEAALAESNGLLVRLSEELTTLRAQISSSPVEAELRKALESAKDEAAKLAEDSVALQILKGEQQIKEEEVVGLQSKMETLESKLATKCDEVLDLQDQYKEMAQTVDNYTR